LSNSWLLRLKTTKLALILTTKISQIFMWIGIIGDVKLTSDILTGRKISPVAAWQRAESMLKHPKENLYLWFI
jgi:hypothetical protein